jgi:hypothetical protein
LSEGKPTCPTALEDVTFKFPASMLAATPTELVIRCHFTWR